MIERDFQIAKAVITFFEKCFTQSYQSEGWNTWPRGVHVHTTLPYLTWHATESSRWGKQLAMLRFDLLILSGENGLSRTEHWRGDFSHHTEEVTQRGSVCRLSGIILNYGRKIVEDCCWEAVETRFVRQHSAAGWVGSSPHVQQVLQ